MVKTTNLPEGDFGNLNRKPGCHQGLGIERRIRFIKDYFAKIT